MRAVLRLFPPQWRDRYGADFADHFAADPRGVTKWADAVWTAGGLRWRTARESGNGLALGLVVALSTALLCDVSLGVGMDERMDADLLQHWWGAPFAGLLAVSAVLVITTVAAILADRRRRRVSIVITAALAVGSAAGWAIFAVFSFDLAGAGAGVGLAVAMAAARARLRTPLTRADTIVAMSVPIIAMLGWRTASSPVAPLLLLIVAGTLMSTRVRRHPTVSSR